MNKSNDSNKRNRGRKGSRRKAGKGSNTEPVVTNFENIIALLQEELRIEKEETKKAKAGIIMLNAELYKYKEEKDELDYGEMMVVGATSVWLPCCLDEIGLSDEERASIESFWDLDRYIRSHPDGYHCMKNCLLESSMLDSYFSIRRSEVVTKRRTSCYRAISWKQFAI